MFGTLRTMLALMVLVGHIGSSGLLGTYAVFAFYIISGYLMTMIMHESYGYTATGRARFALNRFLRLYPLYWVCLLLSTLVVLHVGTTYSSHYESAMYLPTTIPEYASIVTMLFIDVFPNQVEPNLLPATWALTVEIFFYALIGLGISRTRRRVLWWLALSFGYVVYCHVAGLHWPYKYYPVAAASLPFAVGAYIYFLKKAGYPAISDTWLTSPVFLMAMILGNAALLESSLSYLQTGFYVNLFLAILLIYELAAGRQWSLFGMKLAGSIDKRLGDYSYPIYLLHWPIGLLIAHTLSAGVAKRMTGEGLVVVLLTIAVSFGVSHILLKLVGNPVDRIRAAVKTR